MRKRIEHYFEYRWLNYKNLAFGEDDKHLWSEFTDDEIDGLYLNFMYEQFLKNYIPIFQFKKNENIHSRYVWGDHNYRIFILAILSKLEPCHEHSNEILINENDEFMSVVFFMKGSF